MWRALAYLVLLAVAAFGAVWIADRPGTVTVVWNGYQIGTSLSLAIVGVIAAAIVLGLVWAILRGVINLPEALVRGSAERRRSKGLSALSRGMVAVGSGDPLAARRYANDAERLLGAEPLTLLLKAQAAQISGDRDGAEQAFRAMVDDSETRVLGLRGLFVEARRREDEEAARAYATEAARLAPSVTWANDAVLEAHCADTDWAAALETVERRASLGLIDKAQAKRQRAVLLTAIAREREAGEPEAATTRRWRRSSSRPASSPPPASPDGCSPAAATSRRPPGPSRGRGGSIRIPILPRSTSTCAPAIPSATALPAPRPSPSSRPGTPRRVSPSPRRRWTPASSPAPVRRCNPCWPTARRRAPA